LIWLFVAWIGVMFLSALGLYISEVGVNEAVRTPLDALWWGLTTMTTVGYGDVYPTTAEGRISAAVLMNPRDRVVLGYHGDVDELSDLR